MKKPVLVYGLCLLLGATMLFGCSDDSNNTAGAPGSGMSDIDAVAADKAALSFDTIKGNNTSQSSVI